VTCPIHCIHRLESSTLTEDSSDESGKLLRLWSGLLLPIRVHDGLFSETGVIKLQIVTRGWRNGNFSYDVGFFFFFFVTLKTPPAIYGMF
jgi:hypothetical protein